MSVTVGTPTVAAKSLPRILSARSISRRTSHRVLFSRRATRRRRDYAGPDETAVPTLPKCTTMLITGERRRIRTLPRPRLRAPLQSAKLRATLRRWRRSAGQRAAMAPIAVRTRVDRGGDAVVVAAGPPWRTPLADARRANVSGRNLPAEIRFAAGESRGNDSRGYDSRGRDQRSPKIGAAGPWV
jgi:hypothetical protein